jgi:acyl-CoA synthetase (AMP-forming)/AMP-acid ligase II
MTLGVGMPFMADIVRVQAQERGGHAAIVFESQSVSYAELDQRSNQCAQAMLAAGLRRQARVALLDFNSSLYFEVLFSAAKIDCATVGVNARLAAPEVLFILEDSTASVLFVGSEHYALIESIETQLATAPLIIALNGGHPRWPAFRDWCAVQPAQDPRLELHDDSDVIQLYTSGTTGHPKGVCHTNRTWRLLAGACRAAQWGDYGHDTVTLVCLPLFHVAGFNLACLALFGGGTALLTRKLDVEEILRFIPRYGVTDTLFVPAVILVIVSHPQAPGTDFSSLRCISYGAAPIAEDLLRRARAMFGCSFVHLYGLSENFGAGTYLPAPMHDPQLGKLRSCGRPYSGLELKIVDHQGGELQAGEVGEILLRCEWVMRGYWRNDTATAAAVRDRWLHTGDAGYVDADGYLYIHDRVKDMIVTGGENVYPAEVENALFGHPSIADVAVIGVPDQKWGEAVKALVVLKSGATLDVEALLDFARQRIAGYKLPKTIDVLDALPRNASGKVLRRELREPFWRGQTRRVS